MALPISYNPGSEQESVRAVITGVIKALVTAQEAKSEFLTGHSARVADLAGSIAAELDLDDDTIDAIRVAGQVHDIGMIGVRESVLNKPGALTDEEFAHVKSHVAISLAILAPIPHLGTVVRYVADHHEHWDGAGYPLGLSGEDISIGGRVLCAADAYEALIAPRAWRDAMSPDEAVAFLEQRAGRLLDPAVMSAMTRVVKGRRTLTFIRAIGD